ncbi:DNA repair protein rad2 [Acarospora aff. strigata]|nr:DNA repair protein rad2 [Acarospora aff. strigata]
MGVTGLWTVVQPCARPIKIETLNKKRLAVDASIWIYQFLKAVRDKEGNALRNSHVVGFFRRICKLLFFGIKPVFVFDGGAPALKRQTISGRKARREGRREDAVRTAGKLLAVQMQRRAEEEDRRRREERDRRPRDDIEEEEEVPDNLVYVDELQMTERERQQNRQFKKKDAYHLPELDVSLAEMGAPNDPRIMSHEELEEYARQFHTGEDINLYDFSKIDFNSPFFLSLPASDRYNILNAARLRSRLRMGYSKDQLDTMFPDRMAFSRFQIERVKERNELTQRLMNLNGMNDEDAMFGINGPGRVAGEKGKEYMLVKNDGVEGGWALGVVSNREEGKRNRPIDVDHLEQVKDEEKQDEEWEDEGDGFEDVPIEGLNRLPKRQRSSLKPALDSGLASADILQKRTALYEARKTGSGQSKATTTRSEPPNPDSLFITEDAEDDWEDVPNAYTDDLFDDHDDRLEEYDDEDLDRAIAMSLENPASEDEMEVQPKPISTQQYQGPRIDQPLKFNQANARVGREFAHMANARAHGVVPVVSDAARSDNDDDDDMDLQAALAESRRTKYQPHGGPKVFGLRNPDRVDRSASPNLMPSKPSPPASPAIVNSFDGPLPFESLNLGKSIFGKKKVKPTAEEDAGGFERSSKDKEKSTQPLPPWFSEQVSTDKAPHQAFEDPLKQLEEWRAGESELDKESILRRQQTGEVIEIDEPVPTNNEVIEVPSSDDDDVQEVPVEDVLPIDLELRMNDVADLIRAEPPVSHIPTDVQSKEHDMDLTDKHPPTLTTSPAAVQIEPGEEDEPFDWEESDHEEQAAGNPTPNHDIQPAGGVLQDTKSTSPTPEFENVGIPETPTAAQQTQSKPTESAIAVPSLPQLDSFDQKPYEDLPANDDEEIYSDPEDDELLRQLAVEAEEHARFASSLNSKSQLQNAEDYERELKQLRNQQKKDRRDADEVSHIMVTECQQLLKLFGLPYVTAPMEAEAQCAELVNLGLVDGIVTDDSDIFLFGGTRVYKNMFNQAKFVECYLASDLEKEYALDRHKLIGIAHLLGSDYTEGLPTVGPVTALEILSEFGSLDAFKDWWAKVQSGVKLPDDARSPFRRKFKRNAAKLFLPPTFPDKRVDVAYLQPDVDSDPSSFAWGVPDLDALRAFLMATIGWSQERTDEVLVPVIRDMNRRENEGTQANITNFFTGSAGAGAFAPRRRKEGKSRRMESALGRLQERARMSRGEGEGEEDGNSDEAFRTNDAATTAGERPSDADPATATVPTSSHAESRKRGAEKLLPTSPSSNSDDDYRTPKKSQKRAKAGTRARAKRKAHG